MSIRPLPALIACLVAHSAVSQTIPSSVEPGQIQRQLQELKMPRSEPGTFAPPAPQQLPPPEASDVSFILRDVQIEGSTVYNAEELASSIRSRVGQEIKVADVFRLANELTARYRREGYILSQVLVPPQRITDGHLKLLAIEGFVEKVHFRGGAPEGDALLARYGSNIERSRPLTAAVLERNLLLMNDLGRSAARGTLAPSANTPGAADLFVDFTRQRSSSAVSSSNRNSRSLGPARVTADLDWFGALSAWDRVSLKGGSSLNRELSYVGAGYGRMLGHAGAQGNFAVTGVKSEPGRAANLTATDLETQSLSGSVQLGMPILRGRTMNVYVRAAFTTFDGQSELVLASLSDDRIRALRAGVTVDVADHLRGISMLDIEYSQGLNALGACKSGTASSPLSRANGRSDFSKLTLYAGRLQSLGGRWSALVAASAQQSFSSLLAPELFAFGGELFGRGYDAAELVGDSGEALKVELRYATAFQELDVGAATPYAFFDWGRVRRRDAINEPAREAASSWGVGLRVTGNQGRWQGFFEIADPINRDVAAEGNRNARAFAGFQLNL